MEFKILGHACLLVKSETHSIIIDPWLLGSCYWRSWWNFPGAVFDEEDLAQVDAVIISHVHWDHWHGPTLKRFFKGKRIIVPDEPSLRSRNDLRAIGFKNVEAIRHAKTISIGDIEITMHQFGLFLNDAAIIIRSGGVTLLNANDAKIAGWSLEALLKQHGPIDFAFRSHSSANARVNYKIADQEGDFIADDREHYFRSFKLFMNAVSPKYAIPFASNHCHLHADTLQFNSYISNPLELRTYCDAAEQGLGAWQLKVMLPGSTWNTHGGFQLASEEPFRDLAASITEYCKRVAPTLSRYEAEEAGVIISAKTFDKFMSMLATRWFFQRYLPDFTLQLEWPGSRSESYAISPVNGTWRLLDFEARRGKGCGIIKMPAIVFRDAVWKNMFHHAGISKRCQFLASDATDMVKLKSILGQLERQELGAARFGFPYAKRMIRAYFYRWRELGVYVKAAFLLVFHRKPTYVVEEIILQGNKNNKFRYL
jgi:UDP-MurNAc hydroxylase